MTGLRSTLHAAVLALNSNQQAKISDAVSADSDNDGLTDTLEGYWCTDPTTRTADFDGVKDGAEVTVLKKWMNNELRSFRLRIGQTIPGLAARNHWLYRFGQGLCARPGGDL